MWNGGKYAGCLYVPGARVLVTLLPCGSVRAGLGKLTCKTRRADGSPLVIPSVATLVVVSTVWHRWRHDNKADVDSDLAAGKAARRRGLIAHAILLFSRLPSQITARTYIGKVTVVDG